MDYRELKQRVLGYLEAQRVPGPRGAYRNGPKGEAQLMASADAAMTLAQFGEMENLPEKEKDEWAAHINSFQTEEGYYWPTEVKYRDLLSAAHRWDYFMALMTRHALWALNILGRAPKRELSFTDGFVEKGFLKRYVESRLWSDIWPAGNELLAVYYWLQARAEWFDDRKAKEAMRAMIDFIDPYMDPATGYWGTRNGSPIVNGLGGDIHITPIYWDQGMDVVYPEKAIDTTLGFLQKDGFFGPFGGHMCFDYDCVYALANLTLVTKHRHEEIQKGLELATKAALSMQNPDGGFRDYNGPGFAYTNSMKTAAKSSGSIGTWFYPAAIGLAATVLEKSPFKGDWKFCFKVGHMVNVPGWPKRRW